MNSLIGRSNPFAALRRLLGASLLVLLIGIAASGPAQASVSVDQQPLTIQKPLPPNIVLMLDDSGSMAWDFMPDADDLAGYKRGAAEDSIRSAFVPLDALRSSAVNNAYYNPDTTYTAPLTADGASKYRADPTSLSNAYSNVFSTNTTVDVTKYRSDSLCGFNNYPLSASYPCPNSLAYAFPYYTAFPSGSTAYAPANPGCANGYTKNPFSMICYNKNSEQSLYGVIYYYTDFYALSRCNSGDSYNFSTGWCEKAGTTTSYTYLFTYDTPGATSGTYVRHYIAKSAGDCNAVPSNADCSADAAKQRNVALWFSYYRTRISLAKSGLMRSFANVDVSFRIGFGSIDGGEKGNSNYSNLPASRYTYSDAYNGGSNYIAKVQPFGDGSSNTQRSSFWTWLAAAKPSGGTPLRQALNATGKYYQTKQPWQTDTASTLGEAEELACRQSYTILTTDGFWNGSDLGNDNIDNTPVTNSGANQQAYTYTAKPPYADSYSDTLADVAMKYWVTDLRPSTNEVPPSTEDPAFWQHMATFTLGLGYTPSGISPAGTTVDQVFKWAHGGTAISGFSWPQPSKDSINNIADMAHAAVNGHGGFYSATTPDSFVNGLKDALKRAAERVGTGASLAANSTSLDTGTFAYQANYYTAKWKGDLKAFSVNANSGAIATDPTWTAANAMPKAADRKIYTYVLPPSANDGSSGTVVELKNVTANSATTPPALSTDELAALGSSDAERMNVVNYLRGDTTLEQKNGGAYRNRDTPLGDIVDSQPVYVGAIDANEYIGQAFTGSTTFTTFAEDNLARAKRIYIAANDGMLHAFDAGTGAEIYAFMPGAVITNGIKSISNPDYGSAATPHQFYNDGELTIADVYKNVGNGSWRTVLVGTTGRGPAKAIYALDVTDPSSISVLWERSAADGISGSDYIGQMVGKPVIAQTADGSWSVLIGNGYNSKKGLAALLKFSLFSGTLTAYETTDSSSDNGLAAPVAWMDDPGVGVSTVAYAGDLRGQVWSFDITKSSGKATKLFTATDGKAAQPITAGMLAGKDPANGNVWLFFGTGRYLSTDDLTVNPNTQTQTWYGLIVQSSNKKLGSLSGRSSLVQRKIVAETAGTTAPTITQPARVVTTAADATAIGDKPGWYIDLLAPTGTNGAGVTQGERMVTPNQFQGNLLLGTTRIPVATDICNPSGRGWVMALDPFTGTNPAASFFDLNGDGVIDASDMVASGGKSYPAAGVGFSSLPNNPIFVGGSMLVSFDNGTTSSLHTSGSTGGIQRVSWRELIAQ